MKNIYELKLYEMTSQGNNDSIRRVPGGWVYGDMQGCCFVPFNNEFQDAPESAVTSTNTGSPKLPTVKDMESFYDALSMRDTGHRATEDELDIVRECHKFIVGLQLRAGA